MNNKYIDFHNNNILYQFFYSNKYLNKTILKKNYTTCPKIKIKSNYFERKSNKLIFKY